MAEADEPTNGAPASPSGAPTLKASFRSPKERSETSRLGVDSGSDVCKHGTDPDEQVSLGTRQPRGPRALIPTCQP